MGYLNLLIPGTGGVTLQNDLGEDTGYPARMRIDALTGKLKGEKLEALVRLLSMEHREGQLDPVKTTLKPGRSLLPGKTISAAYNQITDGFVHFPYDWRADMRYSALLLAYFLKTRKSPGQKWNLIGHSQGGLLIILASKLMAPDDPEAFAQHVARVFIVGAPIAGTLNAAHAMLDGEHMGKQAAPGLQRVMRTWPALYQMLPAWDAVFESDGLPADRRHGFTSKEGWNGYDGISEDLINRAVETHPMLRDPLSHMRGPIRVHIMMGRNRPTSIGFVRENGTLTSKSAKNQLGDSLTPHDKTIKWIGEHINPFVQTFKSPLNQHMFLMNDPSISSTIKQSISR